MNRVQIELEGTFEHECFVVRAVAQAQREDPLAEVEVASLLLHLGVLQPCLRHGRQRLV